MTWICENCSYIMNWILIILSWIQIYLLWESSKEWKKICDEQDDLIRDLMRKLYGDKSK